ncbi:phage virion morphogenesis protein [Maridesulfovibrio sp.]|uniref:phage virion morphogenesis protein n=1 Tax=Maridesulfovibrio sp. TaxID=2795000 RepID=UPI0039EF0A30
MAGFSFELNMDKAMRGLDIAMQKAQRSPEFMDTMGETLVSSTHQHFKDGVGPDGKKWKTSQRASKEGGQTLVDSARLRNAVTYEATSQMVVIGVNAVYARIHQLGGKTGRGLKVEMPARPYIYINDEDRAEIRALAVAEMKSMFGA